MIFPGSGFIQNSKWFHTIRRKLSEFEHIYKNAYHDFLESQTIKCSSPAPDLYSG